MTKETIVTNNEVVLRFAEDEDGMVMADVTFPDDMDKDNPRPFEVAGIIAMNAIHRAAENFNRVQEH